MTRRECLSIVKSEVKSFLKVFKDIITAEIVPEENTLSIYIRYIKVEKRPLLTLRLSDHVPDMRNYIKKNNPELISSTDNSNLSIEMFSPTEAVAENLPPNKSDRRIYISPEEIGKYSDFKVDSYSYNVDVLSKEELYQVIDAIYEWIADNTEIPYKNPIKNRKGEKKVIYRHLTPKYIVKESLTTNDKDILNSVLWAFRYCYDGYRNYNIDDVL